MILPDLKVPVKVAIAAIEPNKQKKEVILFMWSNLCRSNLYINVLKVTLFKLFKQ